MIKEPKNKNSIKSKTALKKAFIELLKTKDATKITVTDIVKLADYNRSTFYAHYCDVYSIVEEIQNDIINKTKKAINEIDVISFSKNSYAILKEVTEYLNENKDIFDVCINHQDSIPFLEKLIYLFNKYLLENESVKKINEPLEIKKAKIFYISGGITLTYIKWFKKEINCSLEDLSNIICEELSYIQKN